MTAAFFLLSPFIRWIAGGTVIVAALAGAFYYVKGLGYEQCKNEWYWALEQEAKDGEQIRTDSERAVTRDTPDSVRNDKRNRDNWKRPGSQ
jgi:hypothetical protein